MQGKKKKRQTQKLKMKDVSAEGGNKLEKMIIMTKEEQ